MSTADDARLLGEGAGLVRRTDRLWVRVAGADRTDYLQRMLTQDVNGLDVAHLRPACLLDPRGRILADMLVWNVGEALWLDMPREAPGALAALEKYVILEDTSFTPSDDVRLDLIGPEAEAVLERAGIDAPSRDACREVAIAGAAAQIARFDLGRRPRFVMRLAAEVAGEVGEALGVPAISLDAYHVARVEEGVPDFAGELGGDVLFNEAGLRRAVSWSKGCFPGQEPVVMAMDRGHPPSALCVLAAEGIELPSPGDALRAEEREVGRITSVADCPTAGGVRALGYVRHTSAHVGTDLEAPGGARLRIVRVRRLTRD